jgi:GTPase SAR1 family protein
MSNPNKNKNYYTLIPKSLKKEYHNPKYKNHLISIPARILIVGGSNSGKTNTLMEFIHRTSGTFNRIIICVKSGQ